MPNDIIFKGQVYLIFYLFIYYIYMCLILSDIYLVTTHAACVCVLWDIFALQLIASNPTTSDPYSRERHCEAITKMRCMFYSRCKQYLVNIYLIVDINRSGVLLYSTQSIVNIWIWCLMVMANIAGIIYIYIWMNNGKLNFTLNQYVQC